MNNKPQQKFVEDLLQEDEIDVCALLDAKFNTPIQTRVKSELFKLGVAFEERKQRIVFFLKKIFKTNK